VCYRGAVSDDERLRRRLGDATRDRIADLADGWSLPAQPTDAAAKDAGGRVGTEAVDTDRFEKESAPEALERHDAPARSKPRTSPPPLPPRAARPTGTPPMVTAAALPTPVPESAALPTPVPGTDARPTPGPRDDDATTVEVPSALTGAHPVVRGAVLREPPRLPRASGFLGDLSYVFAVARGVRKARKELLDVEDRITTLKADRAQRLADLGRAAVSDERFDQTAIRVSRDLLSDIEDRRSRHAGAAAAADAELDAIEREREAAARKHADTIADAEAETVRLSDELAPLERDAAAVRRRVAQLKATLKSIDGRIAAARAALVAAKAPADPAAVEAELATLEADREAVSRDEPRLAGDLDALLPRIASLESSRDAAGLRILEARAGEVDARTRATEKVAAVQARRRVESRAAQDARHTGERALIELGERLYADRPDDLTLRLAAVDQQDVAIATAQRRAIELRELLGSIERGPLARGILYWLLIAAAVTAALVLLV